jgi:hypothetical protein
LPFLGLSFSFTGCNDPFKQGLGFVGVNSLFLLALVPGQSPLALQGEKHTPRVSPKDVPRCIQKLTANQFLFILYLYLSIGFFVLFNL